MDIVYFPKGVILGLSIAAPVGPIGVLCIRRTLAAGRTTGFVSGLGAATADAMYGAVAGFGLTFVSGVLVDQQEWLRLLGGLFLCYLALKIFLAKPSSEAASADSYGLLGAYASTLLLTLTNPTTILSFAAIFAGMGVASSARSNYDSAALLVFGVFLGSALWWLVLSGGVGLFRAGLNPQRLAIVNRVSGVVIGSFGLLALLSLIV